MAVILASQSPRRQQLLRQIGVDFIVKIADIDETMDPSLSVAQAVAVTSAKKALAIEAGKDDVVVAADTIVVVDDVVLGKPRSQEEAARMLRTLSGREHKVMTGVTVCRGGRMESYTETTTVAFRPLSEAEIAAYIATNEPMDKAGSYGIQGYGSVFVSRLDGDYFNVMGLPLCSLCPLLRKFGVPVLGEKG